MALKTDNNKKIEHRIASILSSSNNNQKDIANLSASSIFRVIYTYFEDLKSDDLYANVNSIKQFADEQLEQSSFFKGVDLNYYLKRSNIDTIKILISEFKLKDHYSEEERKNFTIKTYNAIYYPGFELEKSLAEYETASPEEKSAIEENVKKYNLNAQQLTVDLFIDGIRAIQNTTDKKKMDEISSVLHDVINNNDNNLSFYSAIVSQLESIKKEFVHVPIKKIFNKAFDYKFEVINSISKSVNAKYEALNNDKDMKAEMEWHKTQNKMDEYNNYRKKIEVEQKKQMEALKRMQQNDADFLHQLANPTSEELSRINRDIETIPNPRKF